MACIIGRAARMTPPGLMDASQIILDIIVLLTAALVVGLLFERLRQSAIVGFIIAGILVGPSVLNWVKVHGMEPIADLGVSLLLFTIGLEFSWRRFREFGAIGIGGGVLQIVVTSVAVAGVCALAGVNWRSAVALGTIVSMSSTATVLRTLHERGEVDSVHGRIAMAILLVQDAAVVPLVLLVTFMGSDGGFGEVIAALGTALGRSALLVVGLLILANLVLPRMLQVAALMRSRELPVVLAVVTWLASTWAAHALEISPALGAFMAGMLLAESPFATQIRSDVAPFRIAFVTLFFASLGLLADLSWLAEPANLLLVAALVVAIGVGKSVMVWAVMRALGRPNRDSLAAGLALGQIGEFSFVLAAIAKGNGILSEHVFQLVVCSTLITLILTPPIVSQSGMLARRIEDLLVAARIWKRPNEKPQKKPRVQEGHVVVVGYGPAGQAVVRALHEAEFEVMVLDLNPRSVADAKAHGLEALVADASRRETLEELGLDRARACIVTVPHHRAALLIAEQVRALSPTLPVIARARYHIFANAVRQAGVTLVIDEEESVGELLGKAAVRIAYQDAIERAG